LAALALGTLPLADLESRGEVEISGDRRAVEELLGLLDVFELWFPIVEP
jgi:alkyl sulfatase BDS1-like metallo-beta-lactamase superfamily hydrolase